MQRMKAEVQISRVHKGSPYNVQAVLFDIEGKNEEDILNSTEVQTAINETFGKELIVSVGPNRASYHKDFYITKQAKKTMTPLIKIHDYNGKRAVSARELHIFLGSKQNFADWIKNRINEYGFTENQDFEVIHNSMNNPKGGRPFKEYAVSVNMAKELAMVEKTEQGRQARQYFIEMEQIAHAKAVGTPQFKKTNINSISAKRVELINTIRNYLRWGDMNKVANELNLSSAYVKRVMINKEFNTEQADKVVNALYQKAIQNKNELLFGYQDMIDMLRN